MTLQTMYLLLLELVRWVLICKSGEIFHFLYLMFIAKVEEIDSRVNYIQAFVEMVFQFLIIVIISYMEYQLITGR